MCFCVFLYTIPFSWSKIFKLTGHQLPNFLKYWLGPSSSQPQISCSKISCSKLVPVNTCKSMCPFVLNYSRIVFFLPDGLQTLAIKNIIGVGITCPVILITGRGSLCPFSYTCIFVRLDGQSCVEAQHYTTIVLDSLFFT